MLAGGIIEPMEEFNWVSPMVVQEKKQKDELRICIDLGKLNDACVHDPFLIPFTDEVLDNVVGKEEYSFTEGFLRILLGHVVCKQGLMVDPAKIEFIINLEVPRSLKQLHATLGHTVYYGKFIKSYAQITAPMEKLLKKDAIFYWNEECQQSLDVLKENNVITPILVFLDWKKEFHVHVDASCIVLGTVLT
eukprot:PITA_19482